MSSLGFDLASRIKTQLPCLPLAGTGRGLMVPQPQLPDRHFPAEPRQQLVKGLARLQVGGVGARAQDELMDRLPASDPAVALLEPIEEPFLSMVGCRQALHAIARKQASPGADGLDQVLSKRGVFRISRRSPLSLG